MVGDILNKLQEFGVLEVKSEELEEKKDLLSLLSTVKRSSKVRVKTSPLDLTISKAFVTLTKSVTVQ